MEGDGTATPKIPFNNPGNCALPTLEPPYAIGWQDPAGSPLVGTFGPDNRTIAFTDCSGFVGWVLRSQSPSAYAAISEQVKEISDPVLREYLKGALMSNTARMHAVLPPLRPADLRRDLSRDIPPTCGVLQVARRLSLGGFADPFAHGPGLVPVDHADQR